MGASRIFKPAVAVVLCAVALAVPQGAWARFDEYPVHPVRIHFLAPSPAPGRLLARSGGRPFDWGDAGIGAASGALACALALTGALAAGRRRGLRRSRPATGGRGR
ncbi:MAG TPA: hypothetical protein VGG41_20880 [Solirubrobacteraceae bacterium]|jgi:hypothetical protein